MTNWMHFSPWHGDDYPNVAGRWGRVLLKLTAVASVSILVLRFAPAQAVSENATANEAPSNGAPKSTRERSVGVSYAADDPPGKKCLMANGLAYGPFRDGQNPDPHAPSPDEGQVEEDLRFLGDVTKRIRIYSTKSPFDAIPKLAKRSNLGISVMQGIHLTDDPKENEEAIDEAVKLARAGLIDSIIVGNETLTGSQARKKDSTSAKKELIKYIREVKKKLSPSKIPVSTAEVWSVWRDNPDLAKEVDFVVAHFYPFWEKHPIEAAANQLLDE